MVFSRKKDVYAPTFQANNVAKATDSVLENEEVANSALDRLLAVDKALLHPTYLYLEQVRTALTKNALYTEHKDSEKRFIYKLHGARLSRVFSSQSDSVAALLELEIRNLRLELSHTLTSMDSWWRVSFNQKRRFSR